MIQRRLYIALLLFFPFVLVGQQLPQLTQHMFNQLSLNPAFSGMNNYIEFGLHHRSQWSSFDGAPRTQTAYLHSRFKNSNSAMGGFIFNDKAGILRNTGLNLTYAYRVQLNNDLHLNMGAGFSFAQFSVNGNDIILDDETDELVDLNSISSTMVPEFSAGILLNSENYYVGISSMQLLQSKVNVFKNLDQGSLMQYVRHYYVMGTYFVDLEGDMQLIPSVLINSVKNNPTQYDINARLAFSSFQFGLSYRSDDAMAALFNVSITKFLDLSYSFDIQTSTLSNYSKGTHEMMIRYKLFYDEMQKKIYLQKRNGE